MLTQDDFVLDNNYSDDDEKDDNDNDGKDEKDDNDSTIRTTLCSTSFPFSPAHQPPLRGTIRS